jgi:imidazole glycerol-phosphate synthase subunit HisH
VIVIADYGLGNISSIRNMLAKAGCAQVRVTGEAAEIAQAAKLILPGVGAFDHGMARLRSGGQVEALTEAAVRRGVPTLGICLGMQLMCRTSEEGELPGLGWIDASVVRFAPPAGSALKVPHMGWNTVHAVKSTPLLPDEGEQRFYFVHSFHAVCNRSTDVWATAHHGYDFAAAVNCGNIYGVQFHPEKSHRFGMDMLSRFVALPC